MSYRIEHDRPDCIGCGACAALSPDNWDMADDGKSDIVGGTRLDDGREEKHIDENELKANMEAAECCPVNVIHIIDEETDERLI